MIDVIDLEKHFGDNQVLKGINVSIKKGDIVSVRGYGRFVYYGADHETKKGKWSVSVGIY